MAYTTRYEHNGGAADTTIVTSITSADVGLTLASGTNWPTGATGPFWVTIDPGTSSEETCQATLRSGTAVTIDRTKQDGTTAIAHSAGATIRHSLSATEVDEANVAVINTVGKVTTLGDLLVASAANAFKRLGIGTANQHLAVNAAGTDIAWAASPQSLMTTLGDLLYASGANTPARLGIGSTNQVLTVIGGVPSWQTPATASGGDSDQTVIPVQMFS